MLTATERALVARDPGVPGLARLLEPEAFAELLQRQVRDIEIREVHLEYLRYKPGTRCLAAYRVVVPDGETAVHAIAHGSDAELKISKSRQREWAPSLLGEGHWGGTGPGIEIFAFPNDSRVESLRLLGTESSRRELLRRVFERQPELQSGQLRPLAYKPERRYVAALEVDGEPKAVVKFYTEMDFGAAHEAAWGHSRRRHPEVATRLALSRGRCVLAFDWVDGDLLRDGIWEPACSLHGVEAAGAALARFHHRKPDGALLRIEDDADRSRAAAAAIGFLVPTLSSRVHALANEVAGRLMEREAVPSTVHGDFYAKQVIVRNGTATILDLDQAGRGDSARDLGLFLAHLERDVAGERLGSARAAAAGDALFRGYHTGESSLDDGAVRLYAAAGALWIAPHFFRNREQNWQGRTETLLARIESIMVSLPRRSSRRPRVDNPSDPSMPFLRDALDTTRAEPRLAPVLRSFAGLEIETAKLRRHKPGRRCLIEYSLRVPGQHPVAVLGKSLARGLDWKALHCAEALWERGFDGDSDDGISIPEPLGAVPDFNMWLQRRVEGDSGAVVVAGSDGARFAARVAGAIHKIQSVSVPNGREHTIADELRILRERLLLVARDNPAWERRLERLLGACELAAGRLPEVASRSAHRDFYPHQIVLAKERLVLTDLDTFCVAHPALDVGNFIAHITEQALRERGDPCALRECEEELAARFLALAGSALEDAVRTFTTLSLARHIQLSTLFERRRSTTPLLLDLCEQRTGVGERA